MMIKLFILEVVERKKNMATILDGMNEEEIQRFSEAAQMIEIKGMELEYNNLAESCIEKCLDTKFESAKMFKGESICLSKCTAKYRVIDEKVKLICFLFISNLGTKCCVFRIRVPITKENARKSRAATKIHGGTDETGGELHRKQRKLVFGRGCHLQPIQKLIKRRKQVIKMLIKNEISNIYL